MDPQASKREPAPKAASGDDRPEAAARRPRRWLDPVPVLGVAATLGLWYLGSWVIGRYMPPPHKVFADAFRNFAASDYFQGLGLPPGGFLPHVGYTMTTVVIGVVVGVCLGCLSGIASARWPTVDRVTDPFVSTFGTVPILVAAPFFLIWFGLVGAAQAILVSFYTTVIMHIYSIQAVRNLHPKYVEYAMTLGAESGAIFLRVILPGRCRRSSAACGSPSPPPGAWPRLPSFWARATVSAMPCSPSRASTTSPTSWRSSSIWVSWP